MGLGAMRLSVAMAAYNGEEYIRQQIDSITDQMRPDDELIISVNPSQDATESIVSEYAKSDSRIRMLICEEKGIIANFENAINACTGEVILLADQDDVWNPFKMKLIRKIFMKMDPILVLHNTEFCDENLESLGTDLFTMKHVNHGLIYNTVRNGYMGGCMAFSRELVPMICPIPRDVAMHDQWIGTVAEYIDSSRIILFSKKLSLYRRHEGTATAAKGERLPFKTKMRYIRILIKRLNERLADNKCSYKCCNEESQCTGK